ncbi:hypothetical protein Bdiaspc4_15225 [Bradyrhizobium diazoefficiens]|uniref:Uncharacterized protein n=1 Tax=Bradyrhizobium diazoefficiens TaxID=1355477 RepID=A0A810AK02_9BRAD|nr:hypothetical protein Bdiaspc4_15225 [Bradyrhizobium diazoefficiens]BCE64365.1 hypothetical protein XF6B_31640 [Bradyrhizobium diazoefficiens]
MAGRRRYILRHCEEPLRGSNPECPRGGSLDCFAALAMTALMQWCATLSSSFRGVAKRRARNPFIRGRRGPMDSGLAPDGAPRNDRRDYFPTHFGGRFSENAFGPSM